MFLALAVFFAAVLFTHWVVPVVVGIGILARYRQYAAVIIGGMVMDSLWGSGVLPPFFFTALFLALSLITALLTRVVIE